MKKRLLALIMAGALSAAVLAGCGGAEVAETTVEATEEVVEEATEETTEAPTEEAAEEAPAEEEATEESTDEQPAMRSASASNTESTVVYDSGFYAKDANGTEFIIFFYNIDGEDVAYINDGTNDAFAKYVSEVYEDEDGNEYVVVTVGEIGLTYYMDGETLYIVDDNDNVYQAESLSEEDANAIYTVVAE